MFGSYGALSKNKLNEQLQNIGHLRSLFRLPRAVSSASDVRTKIDRLGYENKALIHQYPMVDMGLKVFGNEISYWSAEGDDEIKKSLAKLNPQFRILEILSGKVINY